MKYVTPENHGQHKGNSFPAQRDELGRRQVHVHPISSPLYVVTTIANPNRFFTRYKLYEAFKEMVEDAGGILYTVELALRDRHFEVTEPNNPQHIQLRSPSQLWHKEQLINIGIRHLPADWEYVAWIDADIQFARPDWVNETLHLLQHYHIIQMFSHATDLDPDFQPLRTQTGFMYQYVRGQPHPVRINTTSRGRGVEGQGHTHHPYHYGSQLWHSGYAWAARRSALADLGGLGDIAILGSGDHHMACALIGKVQDSIHKDMHPTFKDYWQEWENRAEESIRRNVGYMRGGIDHYWHGPKNKRGYVDRWKVLTDERFDYTKDIKLDVQGVWTLTHRNIRLRDRIRVYFASREEDDIRVD